jgi:DNA-binding response OmpR family regulator
VSENLPDAKKKILVVDDDRQFVKILEDWFKSRGFDVVVAFNGKDAIEVYKTSAPDAVLLDALLPKLDGFKSCQEMRKVDMGRKVPIIMMSALYKKPGEITRAKVECGATDFIVKPLNLIDVYKKVLEEIDKSRNSDE